MFIIISNFGILDEDDFLIQKYMEYLEQEFDETIEDCEDFIPFKLGDYSYIVVTKSTYEIINKEELQCLLNVLKKY